MGHFRGVSYRRLAGGCDEVSVLMNPFFSTHADLKHAECLQMRQPKHPFFEKQQG